MVTIDSLVYRPGQTKDVTVSQMVAVVFDYPRSPAYTRDQVIEIATAWARFSDEFGFPRSQTWGQGPGHETGWFWSRVNVNQVHPDQNNWGGLGADNTGAAGATFGPVDGMTGYEHGALAFMCHYALYVWGEPHTWPEHLRKYAKYAYRLDAVRWAHNNKKRPDGRLLGYLGAVNRIGDFVNGRWAETSRLPLGTLDNGYAYGIVRKANEVRAMPATGSEVPPMSLSAQIGHRIRARGIEVHDIRHRMARHKTERYRRMPNTAWRYTAVHHTAVSRGVRTLQGDIDSWIGHGVYHVNTHGWPGIAYAIGVSLSGRVFILRDIEEEGYHAYTANANSLAVCGDLTIGNEITPAFRASLMAVLEVLHEAPEFPNLRGHAGTYGHRELDFIDSRNRDTSCPGDLLPLVRDYRASGGKADDGRRYFPETKRHILGGFRAHWERLERDGLAYTVLGYPVTDEFRTLVDGVERTVQIFERGALGWYPESAPPWDIRHLTRGELWSAVTDAREQGVLA